MDFFEIRNKIFQTDTNIVFLSEFSMSTQNLTKSKITELIPKSLSKMYLMYIHRKNVQRTTAHLSFIQIIKSTWIQFVFIICAMTILYFLRHGELGRRLEITLAYMDVMIAVIGGGNLRYRDKFEKIFYFWVHFLLMRLALIIFFLQHWLPMFQNVWIHLKN